MKILLALIIALSSSAFALEVDEKLTVRILKTSESKKTIMINRGTEDGLVEGDHAKFIVTAGIVARAVCVRVSPTRSVWSVYRLVNADFIVNDSVMSIKITPPVKITKDESRALVKEDTPTSVSVGDPSKLGIPLADGANDLDRNAPLTDDPDDLRALGTSSEPSIIPEKNIEVFGVLNISGLTASTKTDSSDSFNNSYGYHHIGLGGEWYPRNERSWYSHFSLVGSINIMRQDSQSYNGNANTNDLTEFSVGANWHPTTLPSVTMTFIPYIHLGLTMGSAKSTSKTQVNGAEEELSANGSTSGFSIGAGYKFFTARGFGARILLDYYMRSEKYDEDDKLNQFSRTVGGPRFMVGFGYRF